jgi:ATP-binding cassette subfamily B (MDR/TAP) protein 10
MSPQLALVGLAVVPPLAAMAVIYGRFVRKIAKSVQVQCTTRFYQITEIVHRVCLLLILLPIQDSLAAAMQVAEERIANIRTVKSFSQESRECEAYSSKLQNVLQLAYRESLARGIFFGLVSSAS